MFLSADRSWNRLGASLNLSLLLTQNEIIDCFIRKSTQNIVKDLQQEMDNLQKKILSLQESDSDEVWHTINCVVTALSVLQPILEWFISNITKINCRLPVLNESANSNHAQLLEK